MSFQSFYIVACVVQIFTASHINGGGDNHIRITPTGLPHFLNDPRRTPRSPTMAVEETQSDVLQKLGVSYFQLTDYSSKQFTATLVSRTPPADFAYT